LARLLCFLARKWTLPAFISGLFLRSCIGEDRSIPGAQLVEFDGVGHAPHLEVPERFHAAVLQFLADKP
jgi:pimeloyl-ACP methyl ester carboxylesterase